MPVKKSKEKKPLGKALKENESPKLYRGATAITATRGLKGSMRGPAARKTRSR